MATCAVCGRSKSQCIGETAVSSDVPSCAAAPCVRLRECRVYTRGRGRSAAGSCGRGPWAIRVDRLMAGWPSRRVSRHTERSEARSGHVSGSIWNCFSALQKLRP